MSTPHIAADASAFAKTVLMPGDPLRAKFIAEHFLTSPVLVNNVRGVQGYTGLYRDTPVSVMASGMGMPSIGIYSYELYRFFGVENIIRVGSAGGLSSDVKLRDLVFGMGASTDSAYAETFALGGNFAPLCDYTLLKTAAAAADGLGLSYHVGSLLSTDVFYQEKPDYSAKWRDMGVLAVEMETAALYMNAAKAKKRALAICTVSDHLFTGESLPSEAREKSFTDMMRVALETARGMEVAEADR